MSTVTGLDDLEYKQSSLSKHSTSRKYTSLFHIHKCTNIGNLLESNKKRMLKHVVVILKMKKGRLNSILSEHHSLTPHMFAILTATHHYYLVEHALQRDKGRQQYPPSPKTTCFPSSHGVATVVMKNCDPFVSFPAFAMLS